MTGPVHPTLLIQRLHHLNRMLRKAKSGRHVVSVKRICIQSSLIASIVFWVEPPILKVLYTKRFSVPLLYKNPKFDSRS